MEEYLPMVSILCIATTMGLFFSPAMTMRRIYSEKSAGGQSWVPYLCMLLNCIAWVAYGLSLNNLVVLLVNLVGMLVASGYLWVFYDVAMDTERLRIFRITALGLAGLLLTLALMLIFVSTSFSTAAGLLGSSLAISMFAAPLLQVYDVVQTQSTATLSLPLCVASGLNTLAWTAFAVLTTDPWIFAPNFIGLLLTLGQAALFLKYWGSSRSSSSTPLPQ